MQHSCPVPQQVVPFVPVHTQPAAHATHLLVSHGVQIPPAWHTRDLGPPICPGSQGAVSMAPTLKVVVTPFIVSTHVGTAQVFVIGPHLLAATHWRELVPVCPGGQPKFSVPPTGQLPPVFASMHTCAAVHVPSVGVQNPLLPTQIHRRDGEPVSPEGQENVSSVPTGTTCPLVSVHVGNELSESVNEAPRTKPAGLH